MTLDRLPEKGLSEGEPPVIEHVHHWMIGRPKGATSDAICRGCGATRTFDNDATRSYGAIRRAPAKPQTDTQPAV